MKRPFLVMLSIAATGGLGYWLVATPHSRREILLACGGWVLGFWVAAALTARGHAANEDDGHDEADLVEDDEDDEWAEDEAD